MPRIEPVVDGRTARAQRTRRSIVDALLALIEDGDLAPTAPRIARRAGVSLRSIYQHFEDLESLFADASARQFERIMHIATPLPNDGPLATRLDGFVRQRSRVLEELTPVRRAAMLQEPFSPLLRESVLRAEALARSEVERVFGTELDEAAPGERRDLLAALDAASGWGTWEGLRRGGLSVEAARRVVHRMLSALLS